MCPPVRTSGYGVAVPDAPFTDDEILAFTIGELVASTTRRSISRTTTPSGRGSSSARPTRIREALGDRALRIEHVGSTSVPGLAAKPVIDIDLVVADSSDEDAYVPPLEAAGYVLRIREPDWYEHRLFKGPDTNVNVHVFSAGCEEVERMVAFRDWLRTHDDDRELYLEREA